MIARPSEMITALLVLRGHGSRPDPPNVVTWPIFKEWMPPDFSQSIACYTVMPNLFEKTSDGNQQVNPKVMIRVHGTDDDCAEKIQSIAEDLLHQVRVSVNCEINNGAGSESILIDSIGLEEGPHPWRQQAEKERRQTYTMVVSFSCKEV